MKRHSILMLMLSVICCSCPALAYDDMITHKDITETAIKKSNLDNYLISNLGISNGTDQIYGGKNIIQLLRDGSQHEDLGIRARNHFWNPLNNEGLDDRVYLIHFTGLPNRSWALGQDESEIPIYVCGTGDHSKDSTCNDYSWRKAKSEFYAALTSITEESRVKHFINMYESLGRVIHLLEDMGVPAHTRNDMSGHFDFTRFDGSPKNWFGNLYEYYVREKSKRDTSYISSKAQSVSIPVFDTPQKYWDCEIYHGTDPGATITNNGQEQAGLAEYCNVNFLSKGSMFANTLAPENKHYFPYPNEKSLNSSKFAPHEITAEDGKVDLVLHIAKDKDGEHIENFVAAKYTWDRLFFKSATDNNASYRLAYFIDDPVHEAYASKLIPKTVGYSAGLINHFFRGSISLSNNTIETFTDTYRIHLSAINRTSGIEQMDNGAISMVIKYPLDAVQNGYIVVPEVNNIRSIPRNGTVSLSFDIPRHSLPDNQLDGLLDILVVYRGNLQGLLTQEDDGIGVGYQQIEYFSAISREYIDAGGYSGSVDYLGQGCVGNFHKGCKYKLSIENKTDCPECCATFVVFDLIKSDNDTGPCPSLFANCTSIGEVIDDLPGYDRQNLARVLQCINGFGFGYEFHLPLFYTGIYKFDIVLTNMTTGFEAARNTVSIKCGN